MRQTASCRLFGPNHPLRAIDGAVRPGDDRVRDRRASDRGLRGADARRRRRRRDRGRLRPRRRDGRLLAAPSRRGAARPARRPAAPTSPSARRWASRCCTRGRTGSRLRASRSPAARSPSTPARRRCALDADGLPMHGLLSAAAGWRVERHEPHRRRRRARGALRLRRRRGADGRVPVPARARARGDAAGPALTIATTVRAVGDAPVPIAFGFHPYLRLPGVDRARLGGRDPGARAARLDAPMLPDRRARAGGVASGPLGARTFDDAYVAPADGGAVRARRRRPADRARVRRRLSRTRRSSRPPRTTSSRTSR